MTYPCDQCDFKATIKGNLTQHVQSIHEGVTHQCDQCDYKATQKGNLTIHEGVPHPCDQCDYEQQQWAILQNMSRRYTKKLQVSNKLKLAK